MLRLIRVSAPTNPNRRAAVGLVISIVGLLGFNVTFLGSSWGPLALFPAGAAFIYGSWLINPWYQASRDTTKLRITGLPLAVYAVWVGGLLLCAALTITTSGGASAILLVGLWAVHSVYATTFEPMEFALLRTRRRLGRGVHLRILTLWCGLAGVLRLVWALAFIDDGRYRVFLAGASLTLILGGVAASLKVQARFRKVCTGLHRNVQRLLRGLEELGEADTDTERRKAQQAARRTWDELEEYLLARADTGISPLGVCVLPEPAVVDLRTRVMASLDAAQADAEHKKVVDDLLILRDACSGRIDPAV
ncbi:hypothetical protein [Streptomyces sp. YS-3]|uniref:hypothetical protein n=1 Tax=Streptomyces sp. YS-3 TaxID=3381352 RepID=UPI003862B466